MGLQDLIDMLIYLFLISIMILVFDYFDFDSGRRV